MPSLAAHEASSVDEEPIINRDEALGLLFNVADISDTLDKLYELLRGEEGEADE